MKFWKFKNFQNFINILYLTSQNLFKAPIALLGLRGCPLGGLWDVEPEFEINDTGIDPKQRGRG